MPPPEQPSRVDPRITRTRDDVLNATVALLIDQGWDAVTQASVAKRAGYSRATVYAHWPDRLGLLADALSRYGAMPHHRMTGALRADLIGELISFRAAFIEHRLDRAMSILVERASASDQFVPLRNAFVADGERPLRDLLTRVLGQAKTPEEIARNEAALLTLSGAITHAVLLQGQAPDDAAIAAIVDIVLRGLGLSEETGGKKRGAARKRPRLRSEPRS